jgi:hypothetical protein
LKGICLDNLRYFQDYQSSKPHTKQGNRILNPGILGLSLLLLSGQCQCSAFSLLIPCSWSLVLPRTFRCYNKSALSRKSEKKKFSNKANMH